MLLKKNLTNACFLRDHTLQHMLWTRKFMTPKRKQHTPKNLTRSIPNMLTAAALFCGMAALFTLNTAYENYFIWFFLGAVFFDLMDGRVARWMHQQSALGAELDSLCDMVTFGALPAVAYYHFVFHNLSMLWIPVLIFYTWSTALRLARFNLSTTTDAFSGLPCPVAAIFALTFFWTHNQTFVSTLHPAYSASIMLLAGWLQISNIPYVAFKKITQKEIFYLSALGFLFALSCFLLHFATAIWLSSVLYILWGMGLHLKHMYAKKKRRRYSN
jgi:CDP-diacylglycerol---serine O-phosphatidyltransferase